MMMQYGLVPPPQQQQQSDEKLHKADAGMLIEQEVSPSLVIMAP